MNQKFQTKQVTSPKVIFGLTTLAVASTGLYAITAEASTTYYVTASSLNVRSGAGTSYAIIGGLTKNQIVSVSSISNGWATISYNGRTAYVNSSYLTTGSSSSNNSTGSSTYYVTASSLNVRSGAGTNYSSIGSLSQNQSVSVSSITNGWATISYNGRTAYVSSNYLTTSNSSNSNNNNTNANSASTYYVTASGLNVRSGAGTSYSVIGSLTQNQSISVSSISNGWATIDYNGRTAYVSASYLSANSSSGSTAGNSSSSSVDAAKIVSYAQQFLGVPYVWGGSSPSGFDCSGYIYYVLKQNGVSISRTNVSGYWNNTSLFQTVASPQAGDIIFFQNTYTNGPSHIGIMINSTQFINASSSDGVSIANISNSYWKQHFLGYKRLK